MHTVPTGTGGRGGIATAAVGAAGASGAVLTVQQGPVTLKLAVGTGGGGGGVGVIKVFAAAQQIETADPTKVSPLTTR